MKIDQISAENNSESKKDRKLKKKKLKDAELDVKQEVNGEADEELADADGQGSPGSALNGVSSDKMTKKEKKEKKKKPKINSDDKQETDKEIPEGDINENITENGDSEKVINKSKKEKKDKKKLKKLENDDEVKKEENWESTAVEMEEENGESTPVENEGSFDNFKISEVTKEKLKAKGITELFPVQYRTFNYVYDGEDLITQARTGTGKTLAFALPLIEKLQLDTEKLKRGREPRVIVLAPTRELAKQVASDFSDLTSQLHVYCIYGGVSYEPQEMAIKKGIDILVGTPGRVKDLLDKGSLKLSTLQHVILDEVDRMLDMGFADSVDEVIKSAYLDDRKPQTMLFSATLPDWVYKTATKYLKEDMKSVDMIGSEMIRTSTTVQHFAIQSSFWDRAATIGTVVQVYSGAHGRAMVFCQSKKDADELALSGHLKQDAHVMHGDIPQAKRESVLKSFKEGGLKVLITTDVAARGLDIPSVDLVVQCNPPQDVESYIHRSGRTGRAGRSGVAVLFYKPQELHMLQKVERTAGIKFTKVGSPTTEDIIKASAIDAGKSLDGIPEETLAHFRESATNLIKEKGAVDSLAGALAVISGSTKIVARSLLSKEGFVTYKFTTTDAMRGFGYIFGAFERKFGKSLSDKMKNMTFVKGRQALVFDIELESEQTLIDDWEDTRFDQLEKITELPELEESNQRRSFGGRGGFSGRGGYGGGDSFRGGGGRGRGGGRGGFSRGGSFNNSFSNDSQKRSFNNSFSGNSGGPSSNKIVKFD